MTADDWERVIGEAAGLGARHVTFLGGEPTMYGGLGRLVGVALALGLQVEVYSNLVRVPAALWEVFGLPGVSLAVSWYTDDRAEHAVITGGRDTWRQTRANVAEAVRRGIPVRGGMVDGIVPGQRADDGERELRALGVGKVGRDRLREFGRGTVPDVSQACGHCGHGRAAVLSDGAVTPCPLTRWLAAGNVRHAGLGAVLGELPAVAAGLPGRGVLACDPDDDDDGCAPNCLPDSYCDPLCNPGVCQPRIK